MKSNIYIQEIEKFNDEISIWELIDRHFDTIWKNYCFFSFIVCRNKFFDIRQL